MMSQFWALSRALWCPDPYDLDADLTSVGGALSGSLLMLLAHHA